MFQLMVPYDFKDAARQLERVVLVVDDYTANLPWELMLADDPARPDDDRKPLSLRTPMVRQLSSTRFRRVVRQAVGRNALVIGNPSVENFGLNFVGPDNQALNDPPDLPAAEKEAYAIQSVLSGMGYKVSNSVIGNDRPAIDVLTALYRDAYRILHISAHGIFDLQHKDGLRRSGVVLSDGMLITAAEIEAMEMVPELVFLGCCHLARMDDVHRDGNKLAASLARQLIDIGVRCVIVAGWAVDDVKASEFGQVFYRKLLMERASFGDAVFEARNEIAKDSLGNLTWGAFQAYGDPGWRAEPLTDGAAGASTQAYASPNELLDHLARARADVSRKRERLSAPEQKRQIAAIEALLGKRCPSAWLTLPQLQSALGATWRDVDQLDKARAAFVAAIRAEDNSGYVPIRDIEQLANIEARLGEREGKVELIDLALRRLDTLQALVADAEDDKGKAAPVNAERSALLGSAFKRKAGIHASEILDPRPERGARGRAAAKMTAALARSAQAYREAEGAPGRSDFAPYNALNRLALDALVRAASTERAEQAERAENAAAAVDLARQCGQAAAQRYARTADIWDNVMRPEALLIERLIDGSFGAAGDAALEEVASAYQQALADAAIKPWQLDSVATQMALLSRFYDALSVVEKNASKQRDAKRVADRLLALRSRVHPASAPRQDRPTRQRARRSPAAPRHQRLGESALPD
ncbi:MAG: CHAT domain-containing protein [Burkholderiaceae bacterium]